MKLSKNLLETMAIGLFVTVSISSCELGSDILHDVEITTEDVEELEESLDAEKEVEYEYCYCPGCGMG